MSVSKSYVNFILIALIVSGTFNTLAYKYQNSVVVDGVRFNHPYMQALSIFLGEFLFIILYAFNRNTKVSESLLDQPQKKPQKDAFFVLAIPTMFDLITSPLKYTALNYINSSIYQIMRVGGVIVVTAFYSYIFLKKSLWKFQWTGIAIVVLGLIIVGVSNFIYSNSQNEFSSTVQFIAIVLIIISLFTQGGIFISQDKILQMYEINTYYFVAVQGFWGLVAFAIILPIINFMPCNLSVGCVKHNGKGYWERTDEFFYQATTDPWLGVSIILGVLSVALYNLMGVNVIKYTSAVTRTVVDVIRTLIIWIIGLFVTFFTSKKWENTSWQANLIQLFGYSLLVFGNLIYNKIIVIECITNLDNGKQQKKQIETE